MGSRRNFNPFYPMLVVAGVVFCVTACGYGVMTVRKLRNPYEENPPAFIQWMDENGFQAMMIELAVLAVMCFAAMGTDSFWTRRSRFPDTEASNTSADPADPVASTPPEEST